MRVPGLAYFRFASVFVSYVDGLWAPFKFLVPNHCFLTIVFSCELCRACARFFVFLGVAIQSDLLPVSFPMVTVTFDFRAYFACARGLCHCMALLCIFLHR
jgi:hypothetical protein